MPASSSSEPPFIAFEMTFSCAPCPFPPPPPARAALRSAHPRASPATLLRWARLRCASATHTHLQVALVVAKEDRRGRASRVREHFPARCHGEAGRAKRRRALCEQSRPHARRLSRGSEDEDAGSKRG